MGALKPIVTPLSQLLGCSYPIIQTAMGWVAGSKLVASSSQAGGFGFLAGATIPADDLESEVKQIKQATDANFGVNFHMFQNNAERIVDMVIDYQIKAVSYSRSPNVQLIDKLKVNGVLCIPTIGLPKHALKAIEFGADALVVQGSEGGGHTSSMPTSLLLPEVIKIVGGRLPVAGAGGFHDGKGLVAALAWGADGIAMGTRFLMTDESLPPLAVKEYYVKCNNADEIIVSKAVDGMPQRIIKNTMLKKIEDSGISQKICLAISNAIRYRQHSGAGLSKLLHSLMGMKKNSDDTWSQLLMSANAPMMIQKAMVNGDTENGILPSGKVAAVICELRSCEQLIEGIAKEAHKELQELSKRILSA